MLKAKKAEHFQSLCDLGIYDYFLAFNAIAIKISLPHFKMFLHFNRFIFI